MRGHIAAIYRFARYADDIADEGDASSSERLATLALISSELSSLWQGQPVVTPAVAGLARLVAAKFPGVTESLFQDLLSAFTQDITKHRYESLAELLDYSRRSANPVGRLVLALARVQTPSALAQSDAICSALQLINFWQDAGVDASRGRIYAPQATFVCCGTSEIGFPTHLAHAEVVRKLCDYTHDLLFSGIPLLTALSGRLRWEIAFTIAGGQRILEKIAANDFDVTLRPTLRWYDSPRLLFLAISAVRRSKRAVSTARTT